MWMCIWVYVYARGCIAVSKKYNQMNKKSGGSGSSGGGYSSSGSRGAPASSIWASVKDAIKDLSKLAEEGLTILRAEVQVACFYHLHPFSHLKLGEYCLEWFMNGG